MTTVLELQNRVGTGFDRLTYNSTRPKSLPGDLATRDTKTAPAPDQCCQVTK